MKREGVELTEKCLFSKLLNWPLMGQKIFQLFQALDTHYTVCQLLME
jgi:hypothetical protein